MLLSFISYEIKLSPPSHCNKSYPSWSCPTALSTIQKYPGHDDLWIQINHPLSLRNSTVSPLSSHTSNVLIFPFPLKTISLLPKNYFPSVLQELGLDNFQQTCFSLIFLTLHILLFKIYLEFGYIELCLLFALKCSIISDVYMLPSTR